MPTTSAIALQPPRSAFICTTGTSIDPAVRADTRLEDLLLFTQDRLCRIGERRGLDAALREGCAELHSLWRAGAAAGDRVHLLHTDTSVGAVCAGAIAHAVSTYLGCTVELHRIEGLQAEDAMRFRDVGVPRLFQTLDRIRRGTDAGVTLRIQVTGGFKGVVPYMTQYGMTHGVSVSYLFEKSEELIELPQMPAGRAV